MLVASNPVDPTGHSGLAIAYDQQGRHQEAQAEYRKSLALADTAATRSNLGLSLIMSGNATDALTLLRPLASDPSAGPRIRHNLAFALEVAGQRDEAKRVLTADLPRAEVGMALAGFDAFRAAPVLGSSP